MSFEVGVYSFGNTPRTADGFGSTAQAIRDVLEAVHLADEVGLDFFGFGEHHTHSRGGPAAADDEVNEPTMRMEPETETKEEPKPEAASEPKPVESAKPQLVLLATDDDAVGVCNLEGDCS